MMVVVSYDVDTADRAGEKRLRKAANACEAMGVRVQDSVFEVLADPAELATLKGELGSIIDPAKDSVRIYRLGSNWKGKVETLGKRKRFEQDGVLMF